MCEALFGDRHFVNRKSAAANFLSVLGEFLSKRPGAKKVEAFMAKQLQLKIDQMALDVKIQSR